MNDSFVMSCRECLGDDRSASLTVIEGAQHVVLMGAHQVWRFPRHDEDCRRVTEMADRVDLARRLGLGAPEVIEVVHGTPGRCHLVLGRIPGTSLLRAISTGRPVGAAVGDALTRLRSAPVAGWDYPQAGWATLWSEFAEHAARQRSRLPPQEAASLLAAADRAAEVASRAPIRILHGDLASDNIMVADNGDLAGILDWDGAVLGDPAIDTAAALHVLPTAERDRVITARPWLQGDLERWEVYRDTWALQNLLWEQGLRPPLWDGTGH